ncbi:hypothetical protein EDB80DRAFT_414604 [Ilyonectria destructans]|nr:hypothetical protein EDB80DRAFT_414604 [Ilyonectria destructans]
MSRDTAQLTSLPPEILGQIVSLLPKFSASTLRRTSRDFVSIATPAVFRSIRLQATGDDPERFMEIAESEKLRGFVREVTCDPWIGSHFRYRSGLYYDIPSSFFDALAFLSSFRKLDALHLRFPPECGDDSFPEESPNFRYRILHTVFNSLAGSWSKESQQNVDAGLNMEEVYKYKMKKYPIGMSQGPILLKCITISNLEDRVEPRLVSSDAFKTILGSERLTDLRLHIARQTRGESRFPSGTGYDFFESIPYTWLSSPVAANLKVLSLYSHAPWGWHPKMDFRLVGCGMPNLRVLALRNFIFSHEWQIEWFGSRGLEELYLDTCAILQHALGVDLDHGTSVVRQANGEEVIISHEGYHAGPNSGWFEEAFVGTLRWHRLFSHWTDSMTNLRVFKMGSTMWDSPATVGGSGYAGNPYNQINEATRSHEVIWNDFRYFDCPSPETFGQDVFRYRTGMSESAEARLEYAYYTENEWMDCDTYINGTRYEREMVEDDDSADFLESRREGGGWEMDDGNRGRDEAAFDIFRSSVEARRKAVSREN